MKTNKWLWLSIILLVIIITGIVLVYFLIIKQDNSTNSDVNQKSLDANQDATEADVPMTVPDQPGVYHVAIQAPQLSGARSKTTESVTLDQGLYIITADYQGPDNFMVDLYDSQDEWQGAIFNEMDSYQGTTVMPVESKGDYYFEIEAEGNWALRFEKPVKSENIRELTSISGKSDSVSEYFKLSGPVKIFTSNHHESNDDNFVVYLFDENGEEVAIIANEIGDCKCKETVNIPDGIYMLQVKADGNWDVQIEG